MAKGEQGEQFPMLYILIAAAVGALVLISVVVGSIVWCVRRRNRQGINQQPCNECESVQRDNNQARDEYDSRVVIDMQPNMSDA